MEKLGQVRRHAKRVTPPLFPSFVWVVFKVQKYHIIINTILERHPTKEQYRRIVVLLGQLVLNC